MHRSRLAGSISDCQTGDHDAAEQIQIACRGSDADRDNRDIETDDLEAEVARLKRLGAGRTRLLKRWWAMGAPNGQRLCMVRPQHPGFLALISERRT